MTELRSHVRNGDTLYLVTTGNLFRGVYETVVFALHGNDRRLMREIHRQSYNKKEEAVKTHKEIFDSLKETNL